MIDLTINSRGGVLCTNHPLPTVEKQERRMLSFEDSILEKKCERWCVLLDSVHRDRYD